MAPYTKAQMEAHIVVMLKIAALHAIQRGAELPDPDAQGGFALPPTVRSLQFTPIRDRSKEVQRATGTFSPSSIVRTSLALSDEIGQHPMIQLLLLQAQTLRRQSRRSSASHPFL